MYKKFFLFFSTSVLMILGVNEVLCQEKTFTLSLEEKQARKFIDFCVENPAKILAELDVLKKDSDIKRNEFLAKVNSDPKLLEAFIINPLGILKQHKMLDMVQSISIDFSPEVKELVQNGLVVVGPRLRLCIDIVCTESARVDICLESQSVSVRGHTLDVCTKSIINFVCTKWQIVAKPCEEK